MPSFDKVKPGQGLNIPAAVWNELLDMLQWYRNRQARGGSVAGGRVYSGNVVQIQNTSGSDCDVFGVLGLDDPLFTPTDNLDEFKFRMALKGVTPTTASHWGKFAILLEPAANNDVALAILDGIAVVQVEVGHAAQTYADVTNSDRTKLTGGFFGAAQILWKESGTGTKWAVVRVGTPFVGPVRGVTDASVAKGATNATISVYLDGTTDTGANLTNVTSPWDAVAASKKVAVSVTGNGVLTLTAREC